jgi:hypothetical protein
MLQMFPGVDMILPFSLITGIGGGGGAALLNARAAIMRMISSCSGVGVSFHWSEFIGH